MILFFSTRKITVSSKITYPFATNITELMDSGHSSNFIYFIQENYSHLSFFYIVICILKAEIKWD